MAQINDVIKSLNYALKKGTDEVNKLLSSLNLSDLAGVVTSTTNPGELTKLISTLTKTVDIATRRQYELKNLLLKIRAARRKLNSGKYKFMPVGVNALRYGPQGDIVPIFVEITPYRKKSFTCYEGMEGVLNTAYQACLPMMENLHKINNSDPKLAPDKLTFTIHVRDFPDKNRGAKLSGINFESMGLALAIGIYFNFHLYCSPSDKRENMRRLFEEELSNVAFTGEINDGEKIDSVAGLNQKIEAAEYMGMKRVFCPADNMGDARSKSLSIIPVNSLEQAVILLRYGQYLEKLKEDKSKLPLIEERGFAEIVKKSHFDSMTGIAGVTENPSKRPIEQIKVLNMLDKGLLVNGDGGIGKTTFLRYLRWHYANKILAGVSMEEFKGSIKIPVFIDLRNYDSEKDIPELLRKSIIGECKEYEDYLKESDIKYELEAGRFLVLCDGIDGIGRKVLNDGEEEIQNSRIKYSENYFVFASRESAYLGFLLGLKQVELAELKKGDIEAIIDSTFAGNSERGYELKTLLERQPFELGGNPFFLSLIIEDVKNHLETDIEIGRFRNRGKLFERIVAGRYKKNSDGNTISYTTGELNLIDAFNEFMPGFAAWLWMKKRKTTFTKKDISDYSEMTKKSSESFEECLNNPKLIPLLELLSRNHWGFIHDRFFEYFAGVHLRDEFLKIVSETGMKPTPVLIDYLQEYINMKRWEDIVFNTIGLLVDCEVEKDKIYCKCNQDGFFCTSPPKDDSSCQRDLRKTYPLSRK